MTTDTQYLQARLRPAPLTVSARAGPGGAHGTLLSRRYRLAGRAGPPGWLRASDAGSASSASDAGARETARRFPFRGAPADPSLPASLSAPALLVSYSAARASCARAGIGSRGRGFVSRSRRRTSFALRRAAELARHGRPGPCRRCLARPAGCIARTAANRHPASAALLRTPGLPAGTPPCKPAAQPRLASAVSRRPLQRLGLARRTPSRRPSGNAANRSSAGRWPQHRRGRPGHFVPSSEVRHAGHPAAQGARCRHAPSPALTGRRAPAAPAGGPAQHCRPSPARARALRQRSASPAARWRRK